MKIYIYLTNGSVGQYEIENEFKAREHAEKIWKSGYRMQIGNRMEWFGVHYIDKICWDVSENNKDYLHGKYDGGTGKKELVSWNTPSTVIFDFIKQSPVQSDELY